MEKASQQKDAIREVSIPYNGSVEYGIRGTFSIKGSEIQKGKQIVLDTITLTSLLHPVSTPDDLPDFDIRVVPLAPNDANNVITIHDQNNNRIGNIYATRPNSNTINLVLSVDSEKKYADDSDVKVNVQFPYFGEINFVPKISAFVGAKTGDSIFKLTNSVDGSLIIKYLGMYIHKDKVYSSLTQVNNNTTIPFYAQIFPFLSQDNGLVPSNAKINASNTHNFKRILQIISPNIHKNTQWWHNTSSTFVLLDKDGDFTNEWEWVQPATDDWCNKIPVKYVSDGLTPDQMNQLLEKDENKNMYLISFQRDGEVLMGSNFTPDFNQFRLDKATIDKTVKLSYIYNLGDPEHKAEILKKNEDFYLQNNGMGTVSELNFAVSFSDKNIPGMVVGNDVTPGLTKYNAKSTAFWVEVGNGNGSGVLEHHYTVEFIDDSNGMIVGNPIDKSGKNGDSGDLNLKIPEGYVLAKGQTLPIKYQIADHDQVIQIHLVHSTQKKNNTSGVGIRKITYTGTPKNPDPVTQTVHFSRTDTVDDATGKVISSSDWQPTDHNGQWDAVNTPIIAGYKPDNAIVPADKASVGTTEVKVTYSKADQHAKLTVHDDTANTDLNDYAENSTGLYQDQINFKTAPSAVEQELKDKGYNIVSDSFKGSPTYNADDSKNNFVIHVTHKIVPVTPDQPKKPTDVIPDTKQHYPTDVDTNDLNKDVQRSIFYKYEDNTQAEPTVVQKAHFSRAVKVDAVTQKIVDNGTWATKDNYPEVATKSIDGYTPNKTKVDSATPSMTTNQDQTVVYHANDEDAAITYIDDTTGKVLKTDTQKAKYKQTIKFATDPNTQIQTYKDQGYILVSSDWKDGSTYQTDPARNKFTVHLKHGTSTVTPDKPKKPTNIIPGTKQHYPTGVDTNDLNQSQQRQITYTYADSKKQASPTVTQKAVFHRTATVDNVTGKTTYTDWTTSDQYPEVKSPAIEGYTPDRQTVPVTKPELNQKQNVVVVYNPDPEQVDVIAKDNAGKQLSKSTLHGNYNTDYTATTPVIKGYHLIKMPTNTHGTYKTHNDPIIYIYAPDSNSVPEQTDGTPKPDKSSYPNDLTPAKRSTKLPETGSTNLVSELKSDFINLAHLF